MTTAANMRRAARRGRRRVLRAVAIAAAAIVLLPFVLILLYRFVDPPVSAHMARQWIMGTQLTRAWVPLERISPYLVAAVIVSEDSYFCMHRGVDWGAMREVLDEAGVPRGASTIPMQTAKNLFLWADRSYVRKAIEVPLAYALDFVWPKRRTLEIYLNVAEWGPGVFGAEAAARHHFGTAAADLNRRQAALLAASLPNPHRRNAGNAGPQTRRLAARLERRMAGAGHLASCVAGS